MTRNGSLLSLLALSLATVGCSHGTSAPHAAASGAHHSPYASEAYDPDSGLSTAEIEELRSGAGMGLARPAELNSYPGPLHVIDMSDELALTDEQEALTGRVFDSMRATALELGRQIIEKETVLARRFRHGHIDDATLEQLTSEIAELRGDLRRAHLEAHLRMKEILTAEQIRKYDELRGYGSASHQTHEHSPQS